MAMFFREGEQKVRPGLYQRYSTSDSGINTGARDGYCAITVRSNWGPVNEVTTHKSKKSVQKMYGTGAYDAAACTVPAALAMFDGGAQVLHIRRLGTGGAKAKLELSDSASKALVEVAAIYPGTRKISVSIQEKLGDSSKKVFTVYDGAAEMETYDFAVDSTDETANLLGAVKGSDYVVLTQKADGVLAPLAVAAGGLTGGTDPAVTNADYAKAWEALEQYYYNTIALDVDDDSSLTLSHMLQEHTNEVFQGGKMSICVVGDKTGLSFKTRCANAKSFDNKLTVYLGDGFKNAQGKEIDGVLAICTAAGHIASTPASQSIVHLKPYGAVDTMESLTNDQYVEAIESGMLLISKDSEGNVWYDSGVNTLGTLADNEDLGWKKIRRVKTRLEIMDRLDRAISPRVGRINTDNDGVAEVVQTGQGVLGDMVNELKLAAGAAFFEDTENPRTADSAWFVIEAYDIDSLEKIYLNYRFRYQNA